MSLIFICCNFCGLFTGCQNRQSVLVMNLLEGFGIEKTTETLDHLGIFVWVNELCVHSLSSLSNLGSSLFITILRIPPLLPCKSNPCVCSEFFNLMNVVIWLKWLFCIPPQYCESNITFSTSAVLD